MGNRHCRCRAVARSSRINVDFGGTDRGFELSLDGDGKAVLVGETTTGTGGDIAIIRVNKNGTLDTSYDTDGRQSVDFGGADSANELVLDSRGRILVAGTAGGTDMAVVRLPTAGALDTGVFDTDGKQTVNFAASGTETAEGMVIDNYGRIVLAGRAGTGDLAVARLGGGGARHYLIQDANYNVTATAEASGKVADRYQYTPYGQWTALNADFSTDYDNAGEVYQAFYFQGLRFDGNSGNHHARNRDYRASLGRWTQNDPAGYVDGMNLYPFARSSPVDLTDPFGLCAEGSCEIRIKSYRTVGLAAFVYKVGERDEQPIAGQIVDEDRLFDPGDRVDDMENLARKTAAKMVDHVLGPKGGGKIMRAWETAIMGIKVAADKVVLGVSGAVNVKVDYEFRKCVCGPFWFSKPKWTGWDSDTTTVAIEAPQVTPHGNVLLNDKRAVEGLIRRALEKVANLNLKGSLEGELKEKLGCKP